MPCCGAGDPDLNGKPCAASNLFCVGGFCTPSSGNYHEPCTGPNAACNPNLKGLVCVAKPDSSDFWCDCGAASKGGACGPRKVCWDSSAPSPNPLPRRPSEPPPSPNPLPRRPSEPPPDRPGQLGQPDGPDMPDLPDILDLSEMPSLKKEYGSMQKMSCMNGDKNLLKQQPVKTAEECKDLCDKNLECTTYEVNGPDITTCYLSKEIRSIEMCCQPHTTHQLYAWKDRPDPDWPCI